jgi:hypothetical protein
MYDGYVTIYMCAFCITPCVVCVCLIDCVEEVCVYDYVCVHETVGGCL